MSKKLRVMMIGVALHVSAWADQSQSQEQECQRTIESMTAILKQLKNNPAIRSQQINAIIDGHTEDVQLRAFVKSEIVPRVMTQDDRALQAYLNSGLARQRCEQALNTYRVPQGD